MVRESIGYILVGIVATIVYLIIFVGQVQFFLIDPVIASVSAYIPVLISSYYLNYSLVFRSRQHHKKTFPKYLAVVILGFCINTLCIFITINLLNWFYIYGQIIAFILIATSNFLLNFFWAFEIKPTDKI